VLANLGILVQRLPQPSLVLELVAFFSTLLRLCHGDLGVIGEDDGVLAISYSGASKEVVDLLPQLRALIYL